jgi:hypothetical protein
MNVRPRWMGRNVTAPGRGREPRHPPGACPRRSHDHLPLPFPARPGPAAAAHPAAHRTGARLWDTPYGWNGLGAGSSLLSHVIVTLPFGANVSLTGSLTIGPSGFSQQFPTFPNGGFGIFFGVFSGRWFDPPLALGYDFEMTSGSKFTDVLTLPVGIDGDGLFEILVGGTSLGQFAEGSRVDFATLVGGGGVSAFRIVGIDPAADASDALAFPIQLAFDTATADFRMTPVTWRTVGSACYDAVGCPGCAATSLAPSGDSLVGNAACS